MPKHLSKKMDDFMDEDKKYLKKQIDSLTEENFQLKNLIDNLPGDIYWKNKNGIWSGVNKRGADSLKRMGFIQNNGDIIGKTDFDLFNQETATVYRQNDLEVMEKKSEITREEINQLPSGEKLIQLSTKQPLWDKDGNVVGIVGNTIDISYLKKIEEELRQEKNRAEQAILSVAKAEAVTLLSQAKAKAEEEMRKTVMVLVGDIVHDLRTPIATIRTTANILSTILPILLEIIEEAKQFDVKKMDLLSKKEWGYIFDNTIVSSLQSSVSMMDDFINTTLIELSNAQKAHQGRLTYEDLTKCSSRRILENTLDAYILENGIQISQHISYDFYLMGNSILIMRILFNLINNAVEQIALNGQGQICIITEDAGEVNLIKVKDTAGGAPPEVVSQMFSGYFTTKKNGTGIGLAFAKKTMENFGGNLTCNSVYGEYMEFILSFPKIATS